MMSRSKRLILPGLLSLFGAAIQAQQPSPATAAPATPALPIPAVGDMAPDFAIRGATRFGLLRAPVKLSDFRGQTVVLWLFIKARTRG
jgi:hypothetical protein